MQPLKINFGSMFQMEAHQSFEVRRGKVLIDGVERGTAATGSVIPLQINGNVSTMQSNMGDVRVHGNVGGPVQVNMGSAYITGSVSGDVATIMGSIHVSPPMGTRSER